MNKDKVIERLRALQQRFTERLPERLSEIDHAWAAVQAAPSTGPERAALHRLFHGLAGSSGSFGYRSLGECARRGEALLRHPDADVGPRLKAAIEELHALAARGPDQNGDGHEPAPPAAEATIFLLEPDRDAAQELVTQLGYCDYQMEVFQLPTDLAAALQTRRPAAMVVDLGVTNGQCTAAELVESLQSTHGAAVPVIFVSAQVDWSSRLCAVRAGGRAYLEKPVDTSRLVESLDLLSGRSQEDPFRILIVDDTEELAEHYVAILEGARMEARHLTDPAELLPTLDAFRPDLVVMDLYMPGCMGTEVVQVLRQHPIHRHAPVVYLSTEAALDTQLAALRVGGDDFLTKPIADSHLIEAVRIRAARFRGLNELVSRDSLTGLLNHIHFKLALEREVALAKRRGAKVSVVMLDIDHFKAVNDTYGHPVGDRVIASLARLLSQRLRTTDIAARYGGEEFAVILPDTSAEQARNVVDELRERFAALHHVSAQGTFEATFSAGVASLSSADTMQAMLNAADEALYKAKRAGRNQIKLASRALPEASTDT